MRSQCLPSILLLLLTSLAAHGLPPPTEPSGSTPLNPSASPSDPTGTADYATLHSPSSGKRLYHGQAFQIIFTDPGSSASEARFSLANYTGVFPIGHFHLGTGHIKQIITLPEWVAEGTYDFVVSENGSPFGSDEFDMDVVICTVFVGKPRANQFLFTPFRNQEENDHSPALGVGPNHHSHLQRREPHPPVFLSPTSDQSVVTGSPLPIRFLDGELAASVDSARFVLRPLTNTTGALEFILPGPAASSAQTYPFDGVAIEANVTIPKSIIPGAYTLVAQELSPQGSPLFTDVASTSVLITADPALEGRHEPSDAASDGSSSQSRNYLAKRAAPGFRTPTKDQTVITGHHLNISLVNVPQIGSVRFLLVPIRTTPTQHPLVLFGNHAEANGIFHYENSSLDARVFFPLGIANGTYNLVAQEYSSANATKDVASVRIQVQQLRPITRLVKMDSLPPLRSDKPTPGRHHAVSTIPVLSEAQIQPCAPKSFEMGMLRGEVSRRESPTLVLPGAGQEVPIGSDFLCEVQDQFATSETVRFHLRSFSGKDYYLGAAPFVKGIARLLVTCPKDVEFDSYSVVARQNSIKKPKTFLTVVSTSIVVSHQPSDALQLPLAPVRRPTTYLQPRLTRPTSDQYIPAGKSFECLLQNVAASDHVRFMLKSRDGSSGSSSGDFLVGSVAVAKGNIALTTCTIPSSVIPGAYDLVAQRSATSSPEGFSDIDYVPITLDNPRGDGPDIRLALGLDQEEEEEEEEKELGKITPRSLENLYAPSTTGAADQVQVSTVLEPAAYQTIVKGQGFGVTLKNNTSPGSTQLRFLLEPKVNSSEHQRHVLGASTNGEAVHETLRCPDHIKSGTYLFVIQANDPEDLEKFVDSSWTTVVVKDQFTSHSSASGAEAFSNSSQPQSQPQTGTPQEQQTTPDAAADSRLTTSIPSDARDTTTTSSISSSSNSTPESDNNSQVLPGAVGSPDGQSPTGLATNTTAASAAASGKVFSSGASRTRSARCTAGAAAAAAALVWFF